MDDRMRLEVSQQITGVAEYAVRYGRELPFRNGATPPDGESSRTRIALGRAKAAEVAAPVSEGA